MLSTYKTILSQKTQLTSDVYLYDFDLIEPKEINFKAGQYLMIKITTDKGPVSRLYSIASSAAEKNSFELIIQIISGGLASNYLSNLKVKDEIVFQGPAGMFRLKENDRPKIFLATGTGIAPVRSILKNFQFSIFNFQLFWGLKNYQDVYLLDELKQFNPTICLSREQNLGMISENDKKYFELGHIDQCLEKQLENYGLRITDYDFYLCGRREAVESLRLFLINKGVLQENIYFEKF
ncbi:MAG: FAD-binding oxidoreductase [Candidatus Roizmanbacteria bacterium]|nr:FAD-binding oxidoreductase [Candidatus Roizmanbacteria bacterium]